MELYEFRPRIHHDVCGGSPSTFDEPDLDAFRYPIPEEWQTQKNKIEIGLALYLSKYDQATITLMYPPDIREESNEARFRNAMTTLHLDSKTAGEIIQKFTGDPEGDIADRLTNLRNRFDKSKTDGKLLYDCTWSREAPYFTFSVQVPQPTSAF